MAEQGPEEEWWERGGGHHPRSNTASHRHRPGTNARRSRECAREVKAHSRAWTGCRSCSPDRTCGERRRDQSRSEADQRRCQHPRQRDTSPWWRRRRRRPRLMLSGAAGDSGLEASGPHVIKVSDLIYAGSQPAGLPEAAKENATC